MDIDGKKTLSPVAISYLVFSIASLVIMSLLSWVVVSVQDHAVKLAVISYQLGELRQDLEAVDRRLEVMGNEKE